MLGHRSVLAALVVSSLGLSSFALVGCQAALTESEEAPQPSVKEMPAKEPLVIERRTATGVDCTNIAETLTSLELGNYAPRKERAPREASLAATCRDAELTASEAQCVLTASKDTLAYCPKPLAVAHQEKPARAPLPGMCEQYVMAIEKFAVCPALPEESRKAMLQATRQMEEGFAQMQNNPEALAAANDACKQAVDAIRQAGQSMNCPL